jgi:hypothetical protein
MVIDYVYNQRGKKLDDREFQSDWETQDLAKITGNGIKGVRHLESKRGNVMKDDAKA